MSEQEAIFSAYLLRLGHKLTRPRQIILEAVFKTHRHFNAEMLYLQLLRAKQDVSLATIYRTLPMLIESGLIRQSHRMESTDYYEHVLGHPDHFHLVCKHCGAVIETALSPLSQIVSSVAEGKQFNLEEVHLTVFGFCKDCAKLSSDGVNK